MTTFELHAAFESFVLLENKVVRRRRVVVITDQIVIDRRSWLSQTSAMQS